MNETSAVIPKVSSKNLHKTSGCQENITYRKWQSLLARFTVPGMNSLLLSGSQVQLGGCWLPPNINDTIAPRELSH